MVDTATLRANIDNASLWKVDAQLRFHPSTAWASNAVLTDVPADGYSLDDFAQCDPRLPEVLLALTSTDGEGDDNKQRNPLWMSYPGDVLQATMKLWGNLVVPLPSGLLSGCTTTYWTDPATLSVHAAYSADGELRLRCKVIGCEVGQTSSGIPYVLTCRRPRRSISIEWLDQHRPAWRHSVMLADSLQLSPEMFADLLLFAPQDGQKERCAAMEQLRFE